MGCGWSKTLGGADTAPNDENGEDARSCALCIQRRCLLGVGAGGATVAAAAPTVEELRCSFLCSTPPAGLRWVAGFLRRRRKRAALSKAALLARLSAGPVPREPSLLADRSAHRGQRFRYTTTLRVSVLEVRRAAAAAVQGEQQQQQQK